MTIFKTWITAYLLHALFYLFFPEGVGMAALVAVFSFIGSLMAIPCLYIFWGFFLQDVYSKGFIMFWSCLAGIVIATVFSIGTIGFVTGSMSGGVLYGNAMFIYLPSIAAVLSMLINHNGIYNYTQAHLHAKEN